MLDRGLEFEVLVGLKCLNVDIFFKFLSDIILFVLLIKNKTV